MSSLTFRKGDASSCLVVEKPWDEVLDKPDAFEEISVRILEMVRRAEGEDLLTRHDTMTEIKRILNECLIHPLKMPVSEEDATTGLYLTECNSGGNADGVWYKKSATHIEPTRIVFYPIEYHMRSGWTIHSMAFVIGSKEASILVDYDDDGNPVYQSFTHPTGYYRLGIVSSDNDDVLSQSDPVYLEEGKGFGSKVSFSFSETEMAKQKFDIEDEYRFVFLSSDTEDGEYSICQGILLNVSTSDTKPDNGYLADVVPYKQPIISGSVAGRFATPTPTEGAIKVDALWEELPELPKRLKEALERAFLMKDKIDDLSPLVRKDTSWDIKDVVNETIIKPLQGINEDE